MGREDYAEQQYQIELLEQMEIEQFDTSQFINYPEPEEGMHLEGEGNWPGCNVIHTGSAKPSSSNSPNQQSITSQMME